MENNEITKKAQEIKEISWGWTLARIFCGPIFKLLYKPKIINKQIIPKKGPVIFAGNHTHKFDPFLVGVSSKRSVHYMAKDAYDKGKLSLIFRIVGTIPVDRVHGDPLAVARAQKILNKGGAVGIFPEGTRNKTEAFLLPFKFGAVSMAQKTNATIVPFGISGTFERKKDNHLMIRYGTPFKVGPNEDLAIANKHLEEEVGNMMKENLQEINSETK